MADPYKPSRLYIEAELAVAPFDWEDGERDYGQIAQQILGKMGIKITSAVDDTGAAMRPVK